MCPVGLPVHVIQRGNNRQVCFAAEADCKAYAHWLHQGSLKFGIKIHAWVFMTNHVHLLLTPNRAHVLGCHVKMWSPHDECLALGTSKLARSDAYQALFRNKLDQELVADIRQAANAGLALGNEKFKEEVERLTGQRQHHLKRGPKPKPKPNLKEEFLL
jgi:hypothetical protein